MQSHANNPEQSSSERRPSIVRLRRKPKPAHVILTNCEALNGGDAAILLAIVSLVRKAWPNVRLTLIARDATLAAQLYPEFEWLDLLAATRAFRPLMQKRILSRTLQAYATLSDKLNLASVQGALSQLPQGLRSVGKQLLSSGLPQINAYREADLVISTGGTYLVSRYNLEPRVVEFLLAKLHGLPLVLYTQSIGSLVASEWAQPVARCLTAAKLVLVRDRESRDNLAALGFDTTNPDAAPEIRQYADVVFALAEEAALNAAKTRRLSAQGLRVCISVRPWTEFHHETSESGMARYTDAIAALCEHLVMARGAEVEFISTCQGTPGYSRDDSSVATAIVERLPAAVRAKVNVDRSFHSPRQLLEHLAQADLVVATRMHMAILSLCAGTPVLPIEYEFKTRHLFAHLGFEHWVQDIQTITSATLVGAFESFAAEVDTSRERLMDAVLGQRQSACESFDAVCDVLNYVNENASPGAE